MKKRIRHALFDLDGTLIDSADDILSSLTEAVTAEGLDISLFKLDRSIIGPPLHVTIPKFLPEGLKDRAEMVTKRFKRIYDSSHYPRTKPFPGIRDLLADLRQAGVGVGIVTNKRELPTMRLLEILELGPFDCVVCADNMGDPPLKKKDALARLLKRDQLASADCALVGDTMGDIEAAKANDVEDLGILWGYGIEDELKKAKASKLFVDVEELRKYLLA